ncbi:hypothetical protein BGZ46_009647 [Entomortierella lignicola]|nr:hypothetical protein BGZ46_009647 [Entomortierella lignicola]
MSSSLCYRTLIFDYCSLVLLSSPFIIAPLTRSQARQTRLPSPDVESICEIPVTPRPKHPVSNKSQQDDTSPVNLHPTPKPFLTNHGGRFGAAQSFQESEPGCGPVRIRYFIPSDTQEAANYQNLSTPQEQEAFAMANYTFTLEFDDEKNLKRAEKGPTWGKTHPRKPTKAIIASSTTATDGPTDSPTTATTN